MDKEKRIDYVSEVNIQGEIVLPIGHYTIINSSYKTFDSKPKISIHGLGSCIAPIIYDKEQKIVGMSHILLPTSNNRNTITHPHKYANLSIKYLVEELIKHGANPKNLESIIVGGANIFKDPRCQIGDENIKATKEELKKHKIKIKKEETGGNLGRILIFDTKDFSVSIKSSGNDNFKKNIL
ncbi:MAG: chemotaxis protein CheD [Promethearchaeota archaeon]